MINNKNNIYLSLLSILSILLVLTWISTSVYRSLIEDEIRLTLQTQVEKLPPPLKWNILEDLSNKQYQEVIFATPSSEIMQPSN